MLTDLVRLFKFEQWSDYLELCKPKVVAVMLLTMLVGIYLAPHNLDFGFKKIIMSLLGVACCAGSAAALNHLLDKKIDGLMHRTHMRPLVQERISAYQALIFAITLSLIGVGILLYWINALTAGLTVLTLIGYAIIYTGYLKRATSQNIVIGGLAGSAPPLLGWTAVTNQLDAQALLLVLIIFVWTPPHFWALAIYRLEEYRKANIPMLPVIYGVSFTKLNILMYTVLLIAVSYLPAIIGMSGLIYALGASLLGFRFLYWSVKLYRFEEPKIAMQTFRFSIVYLLLLFLVLLLDHYS